MAAENPQELFLGFFLPSQPIPSAAGATSRKTKPVKFYPKRSPKGAQNYIFWQPPATSLALGEKRWKNGNLLFWIWQT
jgi:hypothetical protein